MTTQDPLKSAIAIMNVDNTSLALPSVNQYRSGQQRVLEQVQSVRRSKSRSSSSKSGSTSLSPTSKTHQGYSSGLGGFNKFKVDYLWSNKNNDWIKVQKFSPSVGPCFSPLAEWRRLWCWEIKFRVTGVIVQLAEDIKCEKFIILQTLVGGWSHFIKTWWGLSSPLYS